MFIKTFMETKLSLSTANKIHNDINIDEDVREKALQNALLKYGIVKGTLPSKLYKFRRINQRTLEIIEKSNFYFSSPKNFNDPFDCNLFYKKEYNEKEMKEDYYRFMKKFPEVSLQILENKFGKTEKTFYNEHNKLNKTLLNEIGILSLSHSYKNITMWSHYADNHEGIVFELDLIQDIDFFTLFGLVEYKKQYELLSYAKDNKEELIKLFLTKYTDWEYEEEVRIINYEKNGNKYFKNKMIKSIIFGCKTSNEDIKKVMEVCINNEFKHVKFKKAQLVPGKFSLEFYDIKKEDYLI